MSFEKVVSDIRLFDGLSYGLRLKVFDYGLRLWVQCPHVACEKVASDIRLFDGVSYGLRFTVISVRLTYGM